MITDRTQRWLERRASFRRTSEVVTTRTLDVAQLDERTAKAFVELHHYSRRYPAARFRFGLHERGELVGVAVFTRPFRIEVISNALGTTDGVELGRFVLLDRVGANAETWFLARCFEQLRGRIAGVVSFSDPWPRTTLDGREVFPGHVGTIYQAHNARYLGTTDPASIWLLPDGTAFSNFSAGKIRRGLTGWRSAAAELERFGADPLVSIADAEARIAWLDRWRAALTRTVRHRGLHRYAWSLGRAAHLPAARGAYPKQIARAA